MNTYEIKITSTYYSTGDDEMEALEHLSEFFDINPDDKIEFKLIEEIKIK